MLSPWRAQVLEVAAQVRHFRTELRSAEAKLDGLLDAADRTEIDAAVAAATAPLPDDEAENPGLTARILQRMKSSPYQVFSASDLEDVRGDSPVTSLRTTLLRLAKRQTVQKLVRGRYRFIPEVNGASATN